MTEKHIYDGTPEPGFKVMMDQAVEPYFDPNQSTYFDTLNREQLIKDHPNLLSNNDFLEKIFETAGSICDDRTSEK